jgi:adenylate kinase
MLRAEIDAGTRLGRQAAAIIKRGGLVGDGLVNEMLAERLLHPDCCDGFLLDGYPRTLVQARFLDHLLHERTFGPPVVIHFEVPHHELVKRLASRRECPSCHRTYNGGGRCEDCAKILMQRPDDREEVVIERLRMHAEQTDPVMDYYLYGDYHIVNANRHPDDVFRDVESVLERVLVRVARRR